MGVSTRVVLLENRLGGGRKRVSSIKHAERISRLKPIGPEEPAVRNKSRNRTNMQNRGTPWQCSQQDDGIQ
ncbi:hypothetical protein HMPREF0972_01807 [Actinomyces sp. oral taxon 848 str. F0332]|nr:hypothetical protein HMPREF0972_01807 [Actinomyces sp. oral taxon 848 str. F0332]